MMFGQSWPQLTHTLINITPYCLNYFKSCVVRYISLFSVIVCACPTVTDVIAVCCVFSCLGFVLVAVCCIIGFDAVLDF